MLAAGLLASGARSVLAQEVELPPGPGANARFYLSQSEAVHVAVVRVGKVPGSLGVAWELLWICVEVYAEGPTGLLSIPEGDPVCISIYWPLEYQHAAHGGAVLGWDWWTFRRVYGRVWERAPEMPVKVPLDVDP